MRVLALVLHAVAEAVTELDAPGTALGRARRLHHVTSRYSSYVTSYS